MFKNWSKVTDITSLALDAVLGALADAAASGAVTTADTAMAYIKQILNEVLGTDGGWTNMSGAAIVSLDEAVQAMAKVIGHDAANTFSASIGGSPRTTIEAALVALGVATSSTAKGVRQTLELAVTSAANAGDTTLATVASGSVIVTKIVVFAVTAQHANMTNAAVKGGASKVLTFIDAVDLVRADVDAADKQVYWSGVIRLNSGDTIVMEHSGSGAGALDLVVAFTFHASSADGATMS